MSEIAILIPVLNRPQRVAPLVDSIEAAGLVIRCRPYFLVSPDDTAEEHAINHDGRAEILVVPFPNGPGDWAKKINYGFSHTSEKFVFTGADDLSFHPGWAERAIAAWYETGACVIGTNDLANEKVMAGAHATHLLVDRDYGECGTIDEPDSGKLMHEGYQHNFVDNEFVATAQARDTFWQAGDSHVEHAHPFWHTADDDDTYRLGRRGFHADARLFANREKLWR